MDKQSQIRLIGNQQVDRAKWELCLERSSSGTLYSRPWFLDLVAEGWKALVAGDYEFVMPLPVKSKYGIKYVYQPTYCQQLGIFPPPPENIEQQFAAFLRKSFRLVSTQLNTGNNGPSFEGFEITRKANYTLPLAHDFETLAKGFSTHAGRNIKAAQKAGVLVTKGLAPAEYMKVKKEAAKTPVKKQVLGVLARLISNTTLTGKGVIYAGWSAQNNLCGAVFLASDRYRIYYLNAFSTDEGRQNRVMYAIVNEIIREYAGSGFIFDFEGLVIEGIARFYKGFGATPEYYPYIYSNRIPFVKKFMRK